MTLERCVLALWYGPAWRTVLLWPLEALYRLAVATRRWAYRHGLLRREDPGAPVVVVGNLTVGGTGKTPVASWLAGALNRNGIVTAVVLRGYRGRHSGAALRVTADTDPRIAGDEAVLHARRGASLVFVGHDRAAAARAAAEAGAQLVVSDDGLQHLRLPRQYEIAVVDAVRGLGNGHLLPAGPLREPAARLAEVDAVVVTDRGTGAGAGVVADVPDAMRVKLRPGDVVNIVDGTRRSIAAFRGQAVHALAAIGHPEAFFASLRAAGLSIDAHALPDHAELDAKALDWARDTTLLMTEKDAVKYFRIARPGWWFVDLELDFEPPSAAGELLTRVLEATIPAARRGGRLG